MFHRSERLFLRPAWPEDWEAVYRGIADERIVRNLASAPWPYGPDDAKSYAKRVQDPDLPGFVLTLPGEGVIGSAGMGRDLETDEVILGYWIAREHWGKGFATEAARAVLAIARTLGHRRVAASHFVDNPASGKVLRKAGFRATGEVRPGFSLARGHSDPVACFEALLDEDCDIPVMKHAA